jgi:hypothetical protein
MQMLTVHMLTRWLQWYCSWHVARPTTVVRVCLVSLVLVIDAHGCWNGSLVLVGIVDSMLKAQHACMYAHTRVAQLLREMVVTSYPL